MDGNSDEIAKLLSTQGGSGDQAPLVNILLTVCDEIKGTRNLINEQAAKLDEKFTSEANKINKNIDTKLAPLTKDVVDLKAKVKKIDSDREREKRKRNVLIYGLSTENQDNRQVEANVRKLFGEKLEVVVESWEFDFIKVLGKNRSGPILIGLTTWKKKNDLMRNGHKLKGSNLSLREDFPEEIAAIRKALIPKMKQLREKGHHVILKYDQLIVDRKPLLSNTDAFTDDEEEEINMDVDTAPINEKSRNKRAPSESPEIVSFNRQHRKTRIVKKTKVKPSTSQSTNLLTYIRKTKDGASSSKQVVTTVSETNNENNDESEKEKNKDETKNEKEGQNETNTTKANEGTENA
ncbi:hypothetical protein M8J76_013170 [Diaphorina citri]|jgi:hypothetical protein|nr:hypothetical protein M8J76_013170 [Diaphorina citri]